MKLLYNLGLFLYKLLLLAVAPFHKKAKQWIVGRKDLFKQLAATDFQGKIVWFHCASLGEFEQGRPLMEAIKKDKNEVKILLTFFSPSGYEIRKNYALADYVFYLPLDTKSNARKFIHLVKPTVAVFVKYEFWHHYISELAKRQIPIFSISAIFREKQLFFKAYGSWYLQTLKKITHFFVQNEASKELLQRHGINNVSISGDTRFDRVAEIAKNAKKIERIEKFKGENLLFIAGSSWIHDEEIITKFINTKHYKIKYVFAPHEIHKSNINRLCSILQKKVVKYSEFDENSHADVLIIDNIGLLSSAYQYADIAYVGGAFKTGLHNVLEAATFGIPVICGPKFEKFSEAVSLVEKKGLIAVKNFTEFEEILSKLIENNEYREKTGAICKKFIASNIGATKQIINFLQQFYK
ncbi:MAG: 3-deoxy-D-manno-octulosonic acid transferase [Bacteroidia bacterium]|nr:MAG: 3-deoxy-D-manno-octulosonic acid transferase [Bacteroidia bacterium]